MSIHMAEPAEAHKDVTVVNGGLQEVSKRIFIQREEREFPRHSLNLQRISEIDTKQEGGNGSSQ